MLPNKVSVCSGLHDRIVVLDLFEAPVRVLLRILILNFKLPVTIVTYGVKY